jgi:septin family protein
MEASFMCADLYAEEKEKLLKEITTTTNTLIYAMYRLGALEEKHLAISERIEKSTPAEWDGKLEVIRGVEVDPEMQIKREAYAMMYEAVKNEDYEEAAWRRDLIKAFDEEDVP